MIGEKQRAAAFPQNFDSLFQDANVALKRLAETTRLLLLAFEFKVNQFNSVAVQLSEILGVKVSRETGVYIDKKHGYYYLRYRRIGETKLKTKYLGKNPGDIFSLKNKFQQLKEELNMLEDYIELIQNKLTEFIENANWITELIKSEVGDYAPSR